MLFRKKKTPGNPSWVTWVVLLIVMVALVKHLGGKEGKQPETIGETLHVAEDKIKHPESLVDINDYRKKILPGYSGRLSTNDIETGSGPAAACGQKVSIAYEAFVEDATSPADAADKDHPLTFRLGENEAMPALEQGVIGMKIGGKRSIAPPPNLAYGNKAFAKDSVPKDANVRIEVELLAATPALPDTLQTGYRIFTAKNGAGTDAICGKPARAHITIWDVAGKKIYSTHDGDNKPLAFIPGKTKIFLGLEQGILGLAPGGARSLVVPPVWQKTLDGSPATITFPFPKNQTVLVDIEAVQ